MEAGAHRGVDHIVDTIRVRQYTQMIGPMEGPGAVTTVLTTCCRHIRWAFIDVLVEGGSSVLTRKVMAWGERRFGLSTGWGFGRPSFPTYA